MGKNKSSYIYKVEFLIEDHHHASALAQLLNKLNSAEFLDYKVVSGIELGAEIDSKYNNASSITSIPIQTNQKKKEQVIPKATVNKQAEAKKSDTEMKQSPEATPQFVGLDAFRHCKDKNKLIRLIINRGLGIKASIPCRVINIDENELLITVYHVDEKQVYTFRMMEIEDFMEV